MKLIFKSQIVFNLIAVLLLVGAVYVYSIFNHTRTNIESTVLKSDIEYVEQLVLNIQNDLVTQLETDFFEKLRYNPMNIKNLEKKLQLLITSKYRYVYVVDKKDPQSLNFRFLLDGSIIEDEKSTFGESFTPMNQDAWNDVYTKKTRVYYQHSDISSLWMTYLHPIVVNDKIEAIVVIDFSMQGHKHIVNSLANLDKLFWAFVVFMTVVFLVIVVFSYIDNKRAKQKDFLLEELKNKTKQLKKESSKVQELNVTLENRVQVELKKNRDKDRQLLHQSRLAQMGEMLSMIAHQWRQPLAAISSTSSAINLKVLLGGIEKDFIIEQTKNISNYAKHLSCTIDDFRDFFKPNKMKEFTNFDTLIESVMNIVAPSLKTKGIDVQQKLESKTTFESFSNEIKQVLLNLIKNSEDALCEFNVERKIISIETFEDDNFVLCQIKDNGGGIDTKIIDKIFDPYFSTKTQKDGTGLGLYMSKMIIEEHCQGSLHVHNGEDGAVFTVAIPKNLEVKNG